MTHVVYPPFGAGSLANPTAAVGLAAVNGTALTAMRSDGAPALDQTAAFSFSHLGLTHIDDTTQSTSSTTGSITTAGGLGVVKDSFIGGALNVIGNITGGQVLSTGNVRATGAGFIFWSGRTELSATADAVLRIGNSGSTVTTSVSVPANNTLQLGAANAASPVAQTLQAQSAATGNNNGAATFTDIASLSVGNGTSGDRVFQTGKNGNGSGVLATATTALTIKGETQAVVVAAGKTFQLGNAATTGLVAGVLAATTNASIVITDSAGQAYRIPCII